MEKLTQEDYIRGFNFAVNSAIEYDLEEWENFKVKRTADLAGYTYKNINDKRKDSLIKLNGPEKN
ncbi:hypothetical protein J4411_03230 [Candidatus Pacearchaeota archaeon]|nr:hypothetical protein [Candidatus Pacearchaeota archaeon]